MLPELGHQQVHVLTRVRHSYTGRTLPYVYGIEVVSTGTPLRDTYRFAIPVPVYTYYYNSTVLILARSSTWLIEILVEFLLELRKRREFCIEAPNSHPHPHSHSHQSWDHRRKRREFCIEAPNSHHRSSNFCWNCGKAGSFGLKH